jgi:hypothetical protein
MNTPDTYIKSNLLNANFEVFFSAVAEDSASTECNAASICDRQNFDKGLTLRHIPEERNRQPPRYF